MKLPAYPKLKPSGVEWLGDLPGPWVVKRARFSVAVNPKSRRLTALGPDDEVSLLPMDNVGEFGSLRLDQTKTLADIGAGYTEFDDGDVVIAKITPCFENGKGALASGLTNGMAFGTTELHVLRPGRAVDRRFLFYFTISRCFRSVGEGEMYGAGGQKRVPPEFCKNVALPLPPSEDQCAIADFLDRETARLDALIAKKRTLIERLQEKRTALISRTVTRGLPPAAARAAGLDPNPKLKPSGIDWLEDIPQHWTTRKIKWIGRVGNGSTPNRDNDAYWEDGSYPWLNSSFANQEIVTSSDELVTEVALRGCHLPKIPPPAVLVGITGQGRTRGMATTLLFEATINQHLAFIKASPELMHTWFLRRTLDAAYDYLRSESDGGGSTKGAITCEQLADLPVPLPPLPEQEAIADFLAGATSDIDPMMLKAEKAIERLSEYRTALITAAVTGKVDVRGLES